MAERSSLEILIVEDNPGDRRLIQEMLIGGGEYLDLLEGTDRPIVREATRLEDAVETVEEEPPDVVLLDLNLPDSAGLETLAALDEATVWTPVVVLTGLRDRETGLEALQRGAQDFLVKDEVTGPLLARSISHALERERQERNRAEHRRELETLNRLNRITGDITHAVIRAESRSDLEQRVCDRLVADDAYTFAWIALHRPASDTLVPAASAGDAEGYIEDIEVRVDDSKLAEGPGGRSIETGEVQIVDDILEDESFEPWREQALERGFRSLVAIPIRYDDVTMGSIGIYASEPRAFTGPNPAVLARLGDVVGHAITAIERRNALVAETVVELEFRIEGFAGPLLSLTEEEGSIQIDHLVQQGEQLIAYGSVSDIPREQLETVVENVADVDSIRPLSAGETDYDVELLVPIAMQLFTTAAGHGVQFGSATVEEGELRFIVEVPHGQDTRSVIELFTAEWESIEHIAQRTKDRQPHPDLEALHRRVLTEKQRIALELAYYSGHFEWPRQTTGEELAERLDISPATFAQHLRTAERKVLDALLQERT